MVDDTTLGYIGVSIAVVFFGSYAVPVKLIKTGDGVFFQWVSDRNRIQHSNNSDQPKNPSYYSIVVS